MKLAILNDEMYDAFSGLELMTVCKMDDNEWECETKDGFLFVRVTAAVLSCGFSERHDDRKDEMCIVGGAVDKKDKLIVAPKYSIPYGQKDMPDKLTITFNEIVDFMDWQIDNYNIWDG